MKQQSLSSQSALNVNIAATSSATDNVISSAVKIREIETANIVQIKTSMDIENLAQSLALNAESEKYSVLGDGRCSLFWTAPNQYLFINWKLSSQQWDARLASLQAENVAQVWLTELSSARTVLCLQGNKVLDILQKGCSTNIDDMQDGTAFPAKLSYFSTVIHKTNPNHYDLIVFRSFARSLYDWLLIASEEYSN